METKPKSKPIFPIKIPQHYGDYGFNSQFNCFQIPPFLNNFSINCAIESRELAKRSEGSMRFKPQKPIAKDEKARSKKRRKWWKGFWKGGKSEGDSDGRVPTGPLYLTESESWRAGRAGRGKNGPISEAEFEEIEVPYFSLREVNDEIMEEKERIMPIYLVT